MNEKILYHVLFKCFVVINGNNEAKNNKHSFQKTSNISNPVKKRINASLNTLEIEIDFKDDPHMDVVKEFIRSLSSLGNGEDLGRVLMKFTIWN